MAVKENPYKKYLREDRLPHIFCPGCGNGIVMNAFFKGLEGSEVDFDNVSRFPPHYSRQGIKLCNRIKSGKS